MPVVGQSLSAVRNINCVNVKIKSKKIEDKLQLFYVNPWREHGRW